MSYDYRNVISEEFEHRCLNNPSYSLRSFAKDLELSPSRLCEIMNKKTGTSIKTGVKICNKLFSADFDKKLFLLSIQSLHSRSKLQKIKAKESLDELVKFKKLKVLTKDEIKIVSDWHYFAILELLETNLKISTIEDVSLHLDLSTKVAEQSMERLSKYGFVKKAGSFYKPIDSNTTTSNDIPSKALKNHQEQILEKSRKALYEQPVNEREMASVTLAFDSSRVVEAKEIIRNCRKQLVQLADKSSYKDSVYVFNTQFFKLNTNQRRLL